MHNVSAAHQLPPYFQPQWIPFIDWSRSVTCYTCRKLTRSTKILQKFWFALILRPTIISTYCVNNIVLILSAMGIIRFYYIFLFCFVFCFIYLFIYLFIVGVLFLLFFISLQFRSTFYPFNFRLDFRMWSCHYKNCLFYQISRKKVCTSDGIMLISDTCMQRCFNMNENKHTHTHIFIYIYIYIYIYILKPHKDKSITRLQTVTSNEVILKLNYVVLK